VVIIEILNAPYIKFTASFNLFCSTIPNSNFKDDMFANNSEKVTKTTKIPKSEGE